MQSHPVLETPHWLPVAFLGLVTAACASATPRFPLREPMWRDTDLEPVSVACHADPKPKTPGHQICRPKSYVSTLVWDGVDNLVMIPMVRFLAVDLGHEAVNVNSLDEVPDSSWFTNRIGRAPLTVADMRRGPCDDKPIPVNGAAGSWRIDLGKTDGASPGFRVVLPDGRKYMVKVDDPKGNERPTAAAAIGTRLYWAGGWNTSCDNVIYLRRDIFKLDPGLKATDNTGVTRPFDQKALDAALDAASTRGDLLRFSASRWLDGRILGPFTYRGVKDDDPNDVIPHEDRRDLRGARLMAAWINHFDSREQNSLTVWRPSAPGKDDDASPGVLVHYIIDVSEAFGSQWEQDGISRRLGHAYYLDFGYLFADWFTLGLIRRPWDRARKTDESAIFGYFDSGNFDAAAWRGGYPNPSFGAMTEHDAAWAARIIARYDDALVAAAVATADLTNPAHAAYLTHTLIERRDLILRRYLARLSPVTDLEVHGDELCGVDLARRTRLFSRFQYRATAQGGGRELPLNPIPRANGVVCVTLPRVAADGPPPDDPSRYVVVTLTNGQAPGALRVHLYDLGAREGYRLVGLRRDDP